MILLLTGSKSHCLSPDGVQLLYRHMDLLVALLRTQGSTTRHYSDHYATLVAQFKSPQVIGGEGLRSHGALGCYSVPLAGQ